MKNLHLSIVIPILNEEANIKILVKKININLRRTVNYEIIFVDDNSNDNSKKEICLLRRKIKNIKYFLRLQNKDLSKSCALGFDKAKSNIIAVMDGDLQHDPKDLKKMIELQKKGNFDFVIGVRDFEKRRKIGLGFTRYLASKFIIFIFNLLVGKKTPDPMSGFFIFKKKIYLQNKKNLYLSGYKILADLIFLPFQNFRVFNHKINFLVRKKGHSKMNSKILLNIIILIFFNFIRKVKNKFFLKENSIF